MTYNELKIKIDIIIKNFHTDFDFTEVEKSLQQVTGEFIAYQLENLLAELLVNPNFLRLLKVIAGKKGMHYKGCKPITLKVFNGFSITCNSPYFYKKIQKKCGRKRKKRKKGNNIDAHLGLVFLGFVDKFSNYFASYVAQMSLLCPSFAVCKRILEENGTKVDVKTLRKICRDIGMLGCENRGLSMLAPDEKIIGCTMQISIDGGRIRERKRKRGRKSNHLKRQGYSAEWREPKLFTIYMLDENGEKYKDFTPIHDATMEDADGVFELIDKYLKNIDFCKIQNLVFCADGARWIWDRVEQITKNISAQVSIYQVLDYTHACQALGRIMALMPAKYANNKDNMKQWKTFLWAGKLEAIHEQIKSNISNIKSKSGLKKWSNYFEKNKKRIQYSTFKKKNIPTGSGSVESAIRRVINLRLKSAGTFWIKEMAEIFLFLRSALICGRWSILMNNIKNRTMKHVNVQLMKDIYYSTGEYQPSSRACA